MIQSTSRPLKMSAVGVVLLVLIAGCSGPATEPTSTPTTAATTTGPSPSASPSASTPTPGVDAATLAAARESVAEGIGSGNTAAIGSYMADEVLVTIAASSYEETLTPDEAVAQLDYVVDLTATWNFSLPIATIDTYRAGFYTAYFSDDVLVGLSSTGAVVAFDFDGTDVVGAFMAIDEGILL